jgi:hypothetical protein
MTCWQIRTPSLAMMLQKCMNTLVLLLWLKSWPRDLVIWHQKFLFHQMTSFHHGNVQGHMLSMWITLIYPRTMLYGQNCHSLIGQISFTMDFTFPSVSDQESPALPYRLASSCDCWVIIAKTYLVVSRLTNLWTFIISLSLKPMVSFIHFIHIFVCASLVHRMACLRVAPPRWLCQVDHPRWWVHPCLSVDPVSLRHVWLL